MPGALHTGTHLILPIAIKVNIILWMWKQNQGIIQFAKCKTGNT